MKKSRRRHQRNRRQPTPSPSKRELDDKRFKQKFSFLYSGTFKIACLISTLCLAFAVRFTNVRGLFTGDDEYWHLHILNQMVKLGYRPPIDTQAWAPSGREIVHPPLYHYLIYLMSRLFLSSVFNVMFYSGPFIAIFGTLGWFLLCRELYGNDFFAGLTGASVYAVLPITVAPTILGSARPQALAEAVMPYALFSFMYNCRVRRIITITCAGLLLGFSSLIWESTILLYFPLVIILWFASTFAKKASKYLHIYYVLTLSIAVTVAMFYYLPIYTQFGIWENTPAWMLNSTGTLWRPDILQLLYGQLIGNHVFYVVSIISFPLLILRVEREKLPQECLALTFMGLGLISMFFLGIRIIGATLGFGILLTFASVVHKCWNNRVLLRTQRGKALFACFLCVLLMASAAYMVHMRVSEAIPYYEAVSISSLRSLIGEVIPYNSTVICPLRDAAFLLGHGLRTPWDAYLEHMPPWTNERTGKIVNIFLAKSEDEALKLMDEFGANYLLVRYEQTWPQEFQLLLQAVGVNDDPYQFFNFTAVKDREPIFAIDPNTGKPMTPIQVVGFEDKIVAYEFAPQTKGSDLLLSSLIWNEHANTFETDIPLPPTPQHFRLVWKSYDGMILLYEVIE